MKAETNKVIVESLEEKIGGAHGMEGVSGGVDHGIILLPLISVRNITNGRVGEGKWKEDDKMNCYNGSSCWKELFCFFHVGGYFERNSEGEVKYGGGSVRASSIKEGITLEELRGTISQLVHNDAKGCEIKYTVKFAEGTLVDLYDEGDICNMFRYNDSSAHLYVAAKGNQKEGGAVNDGEMGENLFGLSGEMTEGVVNLGDNYEPLIVDYGAECLTYEGGGLSQTNFSDGSGSEGTLRGNLNCMKWVGVFAGVGQYIPHAQAFREAVYRFSIAQKFATTYVRNSREKMNVRCKVEGCPWKICANAVGRDTLLLRVTTFVNEHIHSAQDNLDVTFAGNAALTSSIILEEIRNHTEKRPTEIRKTLEREYGVRLTYAQAYRAKEKAMEHIHGKPEESYMFIPWICQRLKETDDKTVAEWASIGNTFERVFIAYGSCIEGFLSGARAILYVDGTHLSGPYKGTLLSASGYDADNDLLPFAIAVVKSENLDDWTWFLFKIKEIVGSVQVTIVSDRHNAIIGAVQAIFGGERHAYCYRHVKENFSAEQVKVNRGKRTSQWSKEDALKVLDRVAYARVDSDFDNAMAELRTMSPELHDWVINQGDVNRWAMSKFPFKRWDNITTNIAESFNSWMVKERKHNVAQMIHEHREKVARKMHASYMCMSKWRNCVGPKTEAKVLENVYFSRYMSCDNYGGGRLCVHTSRGDQRVDLGLHQCSCLGWQMSGIPCCHACAAIKTVGGNVYEYVEDCYKISAQEKIYGRSMVPVVTIDMPNPNDYRFENLVEQTLLLPPNTSRPPGRPRTKRQESQFQNKKTAYLLYQQIEVAVKPHTAYLLYQQIEVAVKPPVLCGYLAY
ncbi:uncharacterized protein LOC114740315 [Neltuma alba]|uniref:uncharacterized protein LOC114740315 n=2 Tax=Neltuma alba TaxID=207710 RepID=UPI0010A3229E|nr:uncharacterized protein LOC114740315 [Prosopis alba]